MKKNYRVNAIKLTKPLKQVWKYYKRLLEKEFISRWATHTSMVAQSHDLNDRDDKSINRFMYNFDMFFPMPPYYALMLGSKIRKFFYKRTPNKKITIDIRPYIRPDLDEKLGILIEYRLL